MVRAVMVRRVIARNAPRGPRPPIGRAGHRRQIAAATLHHVARESTAARQPLRLTEARTAGRSSARDGRSPGLASAHGQLEAPYRASVQPVTVPAVPDVSPFIRRRLEAPHGTAINRRRSPPYRAVRQRPMTSVVPAGRPGAGSGAGQGARTFRGDRPQRTSERPAGGEASLDRGTPAPAAEDRERRGSASGGRECRGEDSGAPGTPGTPGSPHEAATGRRKHQAGQLVPARGWPGPRPRSPVPAGRRRSAAHRPQDGGRLRLPDTITPSATRS